MLIKVWLCLICMNIAISFLPVYQLQLTFYKVKEAIFLLGQCVNLLLPIEIKTLAIILQLVKVWSQKLKIVGLKPYLYSIKPIV